MKKWQTGMMMAVVLMGIALLINPQTTFAKTKKIKIDLRGGSTPNEWPRALEKAKKVKIKCSNKSVVKVQYKKNRNFKRIVFTGKKIGKAKVTVKCRLKNGKIKTYKYKVTVIKSKKVTSLDLAKKAFKIQNQYRKEKGVKELEWSDELYKFCCFRLKNSGFDKHKYLGRDENAYFGLFCQYKKLGLSENLYSGGDNVRNAMSAWKKSSGHYANLLSSSHVCGAIACYKNVWIAIFYDKDKSELENWQDYQIKEVKVRRFDSASEKYISGSTIGFYEEDNHWDSLNSCPISNESGKSIYLLVGKTYVIYEKKAPSSYTKAERVAITVTEDGASEVVLTS